MQSGTYSHCWCSERIKVQIGHKRGWVRADWTCLGANYIQAATKIITPNQSRSTFDKEILEMMDRQVFHIWQFQNDLVNKDGWDILQMTMRKDSPNGNANKDCMKVSMDDNDNGYSRWEGLSDKNVTKPPYKLSNHRLPHTHKIAVIVQLYKICVHNESQKQQLQSERTWTSKSIR